MSRTRRGTARREPRRKVYTGIACVARLLGQAILLSACPRCRASGDDELRLNVPPRAREKDHGSCFSDVTRIEQLTRLQKEKIVSFLLVVFFFFSSVPRRRARRNYIRVQKAYLSGQNEIIFICAETQLEASRTAARNADERLTERKLMEGERE